MFRLNLNSKISILNHVPQKTVFKDVDFLTILKIMADSKNGLSNYFQESYQELKKVTWPTKNQSVRLTFIVLGICLLFAAFIGLMDFAFNAGYRALVDISSRMNPPQLVSPDLDNIDITTEPADNTAPESSPDSTDSSNTSGTSTGSSTPENAGNTSETPASSGNTDQNPTPSGQNS